MSSNSTLKYRMALLVWVLLVAGWWGYGYYERIYATWINVPILKNAEYVYENPNRTSYEPLGVWEAARRDAEFDQAYWGYVERGLLAGRFVEEQEELPPLWVRVWVYFQWHGIKRHFYKQDSINQNFVNHADAVDLWDALSASSKAHYTDDDLYENTVRVHHDPWYNNYRYEGYDVWVADREPMTKRDWAQWKRFWDWNAINKDLKIEIADGPRNADEVIQALGFYAIRLEFKSRRDRDWKGLHAHRELGALSFVFDLPHTPEGDQQKWELGLPPRMNEVFTTGRRVPVVFYSEQGSTISEFRLSSVALGDPSQWVKLGKASKDGIALSGDELILSGVDLLPEFHEALGKGRQNKKWLADSADEVRVSQLMPFHFPRLKVNGLDAEDWTVLYRYLIEHQRKAGLGHASMQFQISEVLDQADIALLSQLRTKHLSLSLESKTQLSLDQWAGFSCETIDISMRDGIPLSLSLGDQIDLTEASVERFYFRNVRLYSGDYDRLMKAVKGKFKISWHQLDVKEHGAYLREYQGSFTLEKIGEGQSE